MKRAGDYNAAAARVSRARPRCMEKPMIDVVLLPMDLDPIQVRRSQVVVFDVLRATSVMATALAAGAKEVRLFGDIDSARAARKSAIGPAVLGGERKCVPIPGFDVGNSPAEYRTERVGGATVLLTTTNGTVAMLAAADASRVFAGSLLNAGATARALLPQITSQDTLLLCAGTEGRLAIEDVIGAGAIVWQLLEQTHSVALPLTDGAWMAYQTFAAVRKMLPAALRLGQGGINLIEAGLEDDIDTCARLDSADVVAIAGRDASGSVRVTRGEA